jgi:uncharacterized protein YggE
MNNINLMKKTLLPISVIVMVMTLVTGCATSPSAKDSRNRIMEVTGIGTVKLEPDIVTINIGVQSRSADAGEALKENTQKAQEIIDTLLEMGVESKDIQTRNFNIYQQQENRFPEEETQTTPTYVVENTVAIIVREIDALGAILTKVVDGGANTINSIRFDLEDREAAMAEARKLAIEDAKDQAEAIAETAGVNLGPIQSIAVQSSSAIVPRAAYAMEDAVGGGNVPISGGTMRIEVSVNITYGID